MVRPWQLSSCNGPRLSVNQHISEYRALHKYPLFKACMCTCRKDERQIKGTTHDRDFVGLCACIYIYIPVSVYRYVLICRERNTTL